MGEGRWQAGKVVQGESAALLDAAAERGCESDFDQITAMEAA
jgi:hypothetical protein